MNRKRGTAKEKAALAGGLLSQQFATTADAHSFTDFRWSVFRVSAQWWRWGELNPRPPLWSCAFYGCIQ